MEHIQLFIILITFCLIECYAMTLDEIEDFANFLERTSQLDQNLKKGTDADDYDEDEVISDHAWEESGKFEGDLILNERQRRLIVENIAEGLSRNGLKDGTKRWPNNELIYYIQKEHFNVDQMQAIQNGIDDLARASCVKFRPYQRGDRDAVVIQGSRRGCFSQVGYQSGYQVLNLSGRHPAGRGCFRHGTVVHELLHSLGFYHMQSSPDRDDYVDVIWQNIIQQARHNFRKYNSFAVSDFGVGYDYDSVLHYSRRAFSSNGQDTIVPKKRGTVIGQRVGLSEKDIQKLNRMYCDADSSNFEADEESKQPETKSRSAKNKPFDGHGIGYHQGKAVVIKLLPSAETYKLLDVPSFHLFDYFSKAPQTLSPTRETEEFRIEKEIIHPYHSSIPIDVEDYSKSIQTKIMRQKPNGHLEKERNAKESNVKDIGMEGFIENKPLEKNDNKYVLQEPLSRQQINHTPDVLNEGMDDAFAMLNKIIKNHVYPSSISDNNNKHYSSLYKPQKLIMKGSHASNTKFSTENASTYKPVGYYQQEPADHSSPYFINTHTIKDKLRFSKIEDSDMRPPKDPMWREFIVPSYKSPSPFYSSSGDHNLLSPKSIKLPEFPFSEDLSDKINNSYLYQSD